MYGYRDIPIDQLRITIAPHPKFKYKTFDKFNIILETKFYFKISKNSR